MCGKNLPFATICHQWWQIVAKSKSAPKKTSHVSDFGDLFESGFLSQNWQLMVESKKSQLKS
jgi:hypothetical protein